MKAERLRWTNKPYFCNTLNMHDKSLSVMLYCRETWSHRKKRDSINPEGLNILPSVQNICMDLQRKITTSQHNQAFLPELWEWLIVVYVMKWIAPPQCCAILYLKGSTSIWKCGETFHFWNKLRRRWISMLIQKVEPIICASELSHFPCYSCLQKCVYVITDKTVIPVTTVLTKGNPHNCFSCGSNHSEYNFHFLINIPNYLGK